ncbi:MAG: hypothetical protein M3R00_02075 [Pseudomonadota bacterium]|nr:hypothetical protein [Pseudomonadota bacterium]
MPEYVPDRNATAMHGPFQFSIERSNAFGYMFDPKYTNSICDFDALSLEIGFGTQIFRGSSTWGHALTDVLFSKFTVEYFAEDPDFAFTSGTEDHWLGQWGLGGDIQYLISNRPGVHSMHLALQFFNSENENLPTINGNIRRIAGTEAYGADFGVRVQPWRSGFVDLDLYYDLQSYTLDFPTPRTDSANGVGFSIAIHQNISDCFTITASGTDRRPYYEYFLRFNWIPLSTPGSVFELAAQFTTAGGAGVFGYEERVSLGLTYSWCGDPYSTPRNYHDPLNRGITQELVDYTHIPVVRPPQIFERIDQN